MNTCLFSPDVAALIMGDFYDIGDRLELEEIGLSDASKELMQKIQSYQKYLPHTETLAAIMNAAKESGLLGQIPLFSEESKVADYLNNKQAPIEFKSEENNTTDIIEAEGTYDRRKEALTNFLSDAYGHATTIRKKAEKEVQVALANSIIVDRENGEIINSNEKLNLKLQDYQERLLKIVLDYLDKYYSAINNSRVPGEFEGIKSQKMFVDGPNGKIYSGILEPLLRVAKNAGLYLPKGTVDDYRMWYDALETKDAEYIKAYNALQFLYHFDAYLDSRYGKSIEFELFGRHGRYKIAEKGANNATTWRNSDEITEKDFPGLVKELVITTPLYTYGANEPRDIDGFKSYLLFSDLTTTIGKLKDLVFKSGDIVFKSDEILENVELSQETLNTIKGLRLSKLLNMIRLNPQKYLSAIFEVFSNSELFNRMYQENAMLMKDFTQSDKDIIYSMYKGLFSETGNSVNAISKLDPINNYYSWLTQTCDSLYKIKFLQYYKNLKGETSIRDMSDNVIDGISRSINLTILVLNSIKLNGPMLLTSEYKSFTPKTSKNTDGTLKLDGVDFVLKFNDDVIDIHVMRDGRVGLYKENGTRYTPSISNTPLINWINSVLGLKLDSNLIELISGDKSAVNKTVGRLVEFAARTTMLKYVSGYLLNDDSGKRITNEKLVKQKITLLFGEMTDDNKPPTINRITQELGLVHDKDSKFIDEISKALAIIDGMYSSSLIKSGNGNSQSSYTLSRLLGSLTTQMDYQCSRFNAAMSDSLLIKNKNLFKGAYTAKEFYDVSRSAKEHTSFGVGEFAYSQFLYDFIGGFANTKGPVSNGVISILPSVNSDKNTIGRILIDTNVKHPFLDKRIRDLDSNELESLIAYELGNVYSKTYLNIIDDYSRLFSIQDPLLDGYQFDYAEYSDGFDRLNDILINKGIDPINYIQRKVREYNQNNRNNPIHLIDLIHFCKGNKVVNPLNNKEKLTTLAPNETLLGYLYRFDAGPFEHPAAGFIGDETEEEFNTADKHYKLLKESYNIKNDSRHGFVTNQQFWKLVSAESLKSLIDSRFRMDILDDKSPEIKYLINEFKDSKWIDSKTGNIILGFIGGLKVTNQEDVKKLTSFYKPLLIEWAKNNNHPDLVTKFMKSSYSLLTDAVDLTILEEAGIAKFEFNPLLLKYNYMDYLFSLEFMLSTVGSCIAHPAKGKIKSVLEEEAARFQALHKRNVSFTASMLEFLLGLLNGIPSQYNIAVVDDIKDILYNVSGDIDDGIKPYDGATIVNPFIVHLENNSLGGAKAGITKKLFVHYYDERTGTGGIIKTAGFGITNDWMLNSYMMLRLMKKMTSGTWLDRNGNAYYTNVLKNYKGENINYGDIYFRRNNKYYMVDHYEPIFDVNGNPTNQYRVIGCELDVIRKSGKAEALLNTIPGEIVDITTSAFGTDIITVNSNYSLYEMFGGLGSLEMSKDGITLIPSEKSITNVVEAMNNIGITNTNNVRTQDDIYQPLKHSDIHYIATAGAVKQGAANINSNKSYYNDNSFDFLKINMNQSGILLDKEHHADGTELSLMTLVISACSHLGFSASDANKIYESLRALTDLSTEDLLKPFTEYLTVFNSLTQKKKDGFEITPEELMKEAKLHELLKASVLNVVLKQMSYDKTDESSLLQTLAGDLMERIRNGEILSLLDLEGRIPIDNNAIFGLFLSKIHNYLTNSGIKMKIPGILSVLTPSYEIMKLYGGEKLESVRNNIEGLTEDLKLELLQSNIPLVISNGLYDFSNLKMDRCYRYKENGEDKFVIINTPKLRKQFRLKILNGEISEMQEWIKPCSVNPDGGRNLASYDLTFVGNNNEFYSLWDFDSTQALFELKDILDDESIIDKKSALLKLAKQYNYILPSHINGIAIDYTNPQVLEKYLRKKVREDSCVISKHGSKFYSGKSVFIDGQEIVPQINTIKVSPYELVLPKIFINEFGLDKYDSLSDILNNPDFFTLKIISNFGTKIGHPFKYDIELKRTDGNHVYILNENNLKSVEKDAKKNYKDFEEFVPAIRTTEKKTKTKEDKEELVTAFERIDRNGETVYEISSKDDRFFIEPSTGVEVIITKNPEFYLINHSYNAIHLSDKYSMKRCTESNEVLKLFDSLMYSIKNASYKNKAAKRFYDYIYQESLVEGVSENAGKEDIFRKVALNEQLSGDLKDKLNGTDVSPLLKIIQESGREIMTSFKQSLKVVASRTPSLSMLSFMPMLIVAFDNPNINTAYVNTALIWLLGSDYILLCPNESISLG